MSSEKAKESTQSATQQLWRIAETDNSQQAESLLTRGAEINASNAFGMTALMRAAAHGRMQMVRVLLEHGADPNKVRNDEFTALMLAAFSGHQEIVRILVEHGANPDAKTRFGTTAQMWAASRTFKEVAHYLEHPGSIQKADKVTTVANNYAQQPQTTTSSEVGDNESYVALTDSSRSCVEEADAIPDLDTNPPSVVQSCVELPKARESTQPATQQLWRIAETDDSQQAESLLTRGAEINASNAHGMTALMRAAASGRMRMVRVLLEHGADPNRVRNDKFTALMLAAFSGHQEIVRILIEHGANPEATTRFGTAAQIRAASRDLVHYFELPEFNTAPLTSAVQNCDDLPKAIHETAKVATATNNYAEPPQAATSLDDNESNEAMTDWSESWVKEADANPVTSAIQNCDNLPDVFEPLEDPIPQLWPLAQFQTFSSKVRVVLTILLVSIAMFAHLTLERKQRVAQLAPQARPPAVNESAVAVTARKDSLPNNIEEKAIASPDPQTGRLAAKDGQSVNSEKPSTSRAPITGVRVVTVADSARRKPSEKPTTTRVTQSLPTLEHPQDVATSPPLKPAPISIAKPPTSASRDSVPEKYSAPQSPQLISGSRGSAPSGRVIQWP